MATAEISLEMTCMGAPVQIEGQAYGKQIYFRERGGSWTFNIWEEYMPEPLLVAQGVCEEFMDLQQAMTLAETLCHTMRK